MSGPWTERESASCRSKELESVIDGGRHHKTDGTAGGSTVLVTGSGGLKCQIQSTGAAGAAGAPTSVIASWGANGQIHGSHPDVGIHRVSRGHVAAASHWTA
eukprot:1545355-Rhodomonas_salina.2